MMDHDSIRQAIAAYTLDALEPGERARIEHQLVEHLPGCEECSAMLREFREVGGELGLAATPVPVSDVVEARLLEAFRGEVRRKEGGPPRNRVLMRVAAAVALLTLGASTAWNVNLASRVNRAEHRAGLLARAFAMVGDPQARSVALVGGSGSLILAYRPGGTAVLVGDGIPEPPKGRTLELWLLKDGHHVPMGAFRPKDGMVLLHIPADLALYQGAEITVERKLVPAPTTNPIYAGTLQA